MMAVGDAGETHALSARTRHRLRNGHFAGFKTETVAGINQAGGGFLVDDFRHCNAIGATDAKMATVTWYAHHTVGWQSLHVGSNQIFRGGARHAVGGAVGLERGGGKRGQFFNGCVRHENFCNENYNIARMIPPSTRCAAPLIADALAEQRNTI